jgi:hypothetical protein
MHRSGFLNLEAMKEYTEQELDEIVNGFLERRLDKSLWTHEAHIVTAIWHIRQFDAEDALCRLRSGIIAYNLSVGGENTGQSGYHETLTVFWWEVIRRFVAGYKGNAYRDVCLAFLRSPLAAKDFPFRFYSKEYLLSAKARSRFTEPDLEEISIQNQ